MALSSEDINLKKFLEKVTFTSDPTPGSKLVISDADFLQTAALFKIDMQLQRLIRKWEI